MEPKTGGTAAKKTKSRTQNKLQFAEKATEIIDKGLLLLERRIDTALNHENELDELIRQICATDKEEISQQEKKVLITKIQSLQLQKLGEITSTVGTLFAKRALARGESTENNLIKITLEGELKEWAE